MTTPIESSHQANTTSTAGIRRRTRWRNALAAGSVLAGVFVVILLGVATRGPGAVASLAGFVTAITVIAAAVISWEHVVVNARRAGLVEPRAPQT